MFLILVILFALLNISTVKSDPCSLFETCGQCIGNNVSCVWCSDEKFLEPRCKSQETLKQAHQKAWCKSVVNPKGSIDLKRGTGQLSPQYVKIKARPGDKFSFKMSYKPEKDYPVDVYYLMDNSWTMHFHKVKLEEQAKKIYDELRRINNNVQFGVGSFVEKLALPYADKDKKEHQLNTFINHLPLTDNITNFVSAVQNVQHTSNYDVPEAGLDALMQVMVCEDINWRKEARRMIILGTDSTYHSAGDGKMVGAYKPNDMTCHLKNNSYDYEASLLYDYPSISQINKVAAENNINIFFVVLKKVEREYKELAKFIQGAKQVELQNSAPTDPKNTSDLVELIKDEYKKMVQTLEFDKGNIPSHIEVIADPPCTKTNNEKCKIHYKESISINVTIHVKSCPVDRTKSDILKIGGVGLSDKVNIEVDVLCQCECEKKENSEPNSHVCSKNGSYNCGICSCNHNRYGKTCQCTGTSTEEQDLLKCKGYKSDAKPCSGRGTCGCGGICNCTSENYDGNLCQYGENECPSFADTICAGHGKCLKNKCQCDVNYSKEDCSCYTGTDVCLGYNSKVCSGNGECQCGECVCTKLDSSNKIYNGAFCDFCDTCVKDRCKELEDYVQCYYEKRNKETCDVEFKVDTNRTIIMLNKTETQSSTWIDANWCFKELSDYSKIRFGYRHGRNSTTILIQEDKELPPERNIWIPIGSVIGTTLFLGLLTLIVWKVLVDIHDAREYRKFAEQCKSSGFIVSNTNPLYQEPAHHVINPAYRE